jgi:hypothetical protein
MHKTKHPWYEVNPGLLTELQREVSQVYPQLHFQQKHGSMLLCGSFPLVDGDREIDRYLIEIEFPPHYPKGVPAVYEIGGRIPRTVDRHVYPINGMACLNLPVQISQVFPQGMNLLDFLKGPVQSYFVSQCQCEITGKWPTEQWGHGDDGYFEYYSGVLGISDRTVVQRFRELIRQKEIKGHQDCPCGSGKRLRDCHGNKVRRLHDEYLYYLEQYGWINNRLAKMAAQGAQPGYLRKT